VTVRSEMPVPWTLDAAALDRAHRLVLAASTVAQEALRSCSPRRPGWIEVDAADGARAFDAALDWPAPALQELLDAFVPTTLLAARPAPGRDAHAAGLDDGTSCPAWVGMSASVSDGRHGEAALGDTWLLPPVHRRESARRQRWIEERLIEPARRDEPGGPWWRIGMWNRWRIPVLGWPEQLVLAGLVGTACTASVVVGPPELAPRVGFVPHVAAWLQRTLVYVSDAALQPRVRAAMRFMHRRSDGFLSDFLGFPEV